MLHLKCFVKENLANCKIVLTRPIGRGDNKVAPKAVDDVITQLQELQINKIANEDIPRKVLGKNGLHLKQHGLKNFAVNFIVDIRELSKENSFSIHNLQPSLNQEYSNFQNPLLVLI